MTPRSRDIPAPEQDRCLGPLAAALVAAVIGAAFFVIEHDLKKSVEVSEGLVLEDIRDPIETGSALRQTAYLSLGGLGLVLLCRRDGRRLSLSEPAALAILLLAAWSAASLAWSDDRYLTFKRIVTFGCCLLAALGTARQVSLRDFHRMTVLILLVYAAIGVAAEVALGTFRPWSADYRFAGTVHPNTQGLNAAALILGLVLLPRAGRNRRLLIALLVSAGAILLLTRSRSACFGLAAALVAVGLLRASRRVKILAACAAAGAAAAAILAVATVGLPDDSSMLDALLLGRTEDAATLTGRVPLWSELFGYIRQSPWTGYGYDTFWTPSRIEDVSDAAGWTINSAHSTYLEAILSFGLIGAALLAACVALGLHRFAMRWRTSGEGSCAFFFALIILGLIKGLLESGFAELMFVPVIAACGISHVAMTHLGAGARDPAAGRADGAGDGPLPAAAPPLLPAGFMAVPAE
jgi:O-antigen ligase